MAVGCMGLKGELERIKSTLYKVDSNFQVITVNGDEIVIKFMPSQDQKYILTCNVPVSTVN